MHTALTSWNGQASLGQKGEWRQHGRAAPVAGHCLCSTRETSMGAGGTQQHPSSQPTEACWAHTGQGLLLRPSSGCTGHCDRPECGGSVTAMHGFFGGRCPNRWESGSHPPPPKGAAGRSHGQVLAQLLSRNLTNALTTSDRYRCGGVGWDGT